MTLPSPPARSGFVFLGWFTAVDGGEPFTSSSPVTRDLTVYAQWKPLPPPPPVTFTVTFDPQGGAPVASPVSVTTGASLPLPSEPVKDGFTFSGWFTAANGGEPFTSASPVTQDLTVYAQWKPLPPPPPVTFTVTFDPQGGAPVASPVSVTSGASLPLPSEPVKDGFTFSGWFTAANGGEPFTGASPVSQNLTVYARWVQKTAGEGITVIPPDLITLAFDTTPPTSLARGTNLTISVIPSTTVESYAWYVDGVVNPGSNTSTVTLGASLGRGVHTLTVGVKKNAALFSTSFTFTVN